MSEFDTGYSVVIGKPVVHADKKATGSSVSFPCEAIPDGSYLVSLEVNGSVKAYRESMEFSSGSCTVGAYTLSYSSYSLTVSGTSNNDIVRVMVEPLEVKTTDAFRAAVKKDTPETPNELPAVAAVDEGKVLTVNNSGVWGASNRKYVFGVGSDPSDPYTFYPSSLDGGADPTFDKIKELYNQGYEIEIQMPYQGQIQMPYQGQLSIRIPATYFTVQDVNNGETATRELVAVTFSAITSGSTYISFYEFNWETGASTLTLQMEQVVHE